MLLWAPSSLHDGVPLCHVQARSVAKQQKLKVVQTKAAWARAAFLRVGGLLAPLPYAKRRLPRSYDLRGRDQNQVRVRTGKHVRSRVSKSDHASEGRRRAPFVLLQHVSSGSGHRAKQENHTGGWLFLICVSSRAPFFHCARASPPSRKSRLGGAPGHKGSSRRFLPHRMPLTSVSAWASSTSQSGTGPSRFAVDVFFRGNCRLLLSLSVCLALALVGSSLCACACAAWALHCARDELRGAFPRCASRGGGPTSASTRVRLALSPAHRGGLQGEQGAPRESRGGGATRKLQARRVNGNVHPPPTRATLSE